jgi:hypothetical protein
MVLTFKSTRPEKFELIGTDEHGRKRVCTAEKFPDDFSWKLQLRHPSGQTWEGAYAGRAVLDAMSEMLASRDPQYVQDRERGDRPPAGTATDRNRAVREDGTFSAPHITPRFDR